MKKTLLVTALTSMLAFSSAVVMAQESKEAREAMPELQQDQNLAKIDSAADYKKFTKMAELGVTNNEQAIVDLKARNDDDNKMASTDFKQKISDLEKENDALRKRIGEADLVTTNSWAVFKREFNLDLNELTKALRDI